MMEENITNELLQLKATIRKFVNKYEAKYLGIDIIDRIEDIKSIEEIKTKTSTKDITLSIEI